MTISLPDTAIVAGPVTLAGKVIDGTGAPVAHAQICLTSDSATLGVTSGAVVVRSVAPKWTRPVTGFASHRWNAYNKYVAQVVAGLTFAEFSQLVVEHNPALAESGYLFQPTRTYLFPAVDMAATALVWDRTLTGFAGNRWQCWQRYVAGKVQGLTWDEFKTAVVTHNPGLAEQGYSFQKSHAYRLPHLSHQAYKIVVLGTPTGRYKFTEIPPGNYRLEVTAGGYQPHIQTITVQEDRVLADIVLHAALITMMAPSAFVQVEGGRFMHNGQPFKRFMGVNLPGLLHVGDPHILPHTAGQDQEDALKKQYLRKAQEIGTRVVRLFLPHHRCDNDTIIQRLDALLSLLDEFNMYVIPAFIDQYNNSGAYPLGTGPESAHSVFRDFGDGDERVRLSHDFFAHKYKEIYLPFVERVVKRFTLHPRIFCWEIGNELKAESGTHPHINGHPDDFVAFCLDTARQIKSWDEGRHMVTTGLLSTQHAHLEHQPTLVRQLYKDHQQIDFMTVHAYYGNKPDHDAVLAHDFDKPIIVEEAGVPMKNDADFRSLFQQDLQRWLDDDAFEGKPRRRADGYMPWRFDPFNKGLGSGDFFDDFTVLREVAGARAAAFRNE